MTEHFAVCVPSARSSYLSIRTDGTQDPLQLLFYGSNPPSSFFCNSTYRCVMLKYVTEHSAVLSLRRDRSIYPHRRDAGALRLLTIFQDHVAKGKMTNPRKGEEAFLVFKLGSPVVCLTQYCQNMESRIYPWLGRWICRGSVLGFDWIMRYQLLLSSEK